LIWRKAHGAGRKDPGSWPDKLFVFTLRHGFMSSYIGFYISPGPMKQSGQASNDKVKLQ